MALKRHPALQDYSREHHEELLFVWKIREGLRKNILPQRIIDYVIYQYNVSTSLHMAQEEKYILVKLSENDIDRIKILNDHATLKGVLKNLTRDNADKNKMLFEFADALEKHIRFEERIFFPKLQDSLADDIIKSMQPTENKEREEVAWKDTFWVN